MVKKKIEEVDGEVTPVKLTLNSSYGVRGETVYVDSHVAVQLVEAGLALKVGSDGKNSEEVVEHTVAIGDSSVDEISDGE